MAANYQIFQVDAFASEPFHGNPAAVVPLDAWLDDDLMLRIAAENNLAETAFFVSNGEGYDIRWFTPKVEVALCGHATLASAYVVFEELKAEESVVRFTSRHNGELAVGKQDGRFILDFPAYDVNEIEQSDEIAQAVGKVPVKVFETQGNMVMLLLESESEVREAEPNFTALASLPYDEVIVTAPGDDCDFASRMFAPRIGIPEDPVTGAIHCSLIPFWAERLSKRELFARQLSERGGELFCELHGDRVHIGGNAVLYLKGAISVGMPAEARTDV